jgi:hypothetical protein
MPELTPLDTLAVIASLDRRRREYRDVGWLYVLHNPGYRQPVLKIGKSSRPPTVRADELTRSTGVPQPFRLLYYVHVADMHSAERAVHIALQAHRTSPTKEFFHVPLGTAAAALDDVASAFPIVLLSGRQRVLLPQDLSLRIIACAACGRSHRVRQFVVPLAARCSTCREPLPLGPAVNT